MPIRRITQRVSNPSFRRLAPAPIRSISGASNRRARVVTPIRPPSNISSITSAPVSRTIKPLSSTPIWKTTRFREIVAAPNAAQGKLRTRYNTTAVQGPLPPLSVDVNAHAGQKRTPTVRINPSGGLPEGYRPPINSIEGYTKPVTVAGGRTVNVPVYAEHANPTAFFYNRGPEAGGNPDNIGTYTSLGSRNESGEATPFTPSHAVQQEMLDLINKGRALGWDDGKINRALTYYNYVDNSQNIGPLALLGQVQVEGVYDSQNTSALKALLKTVLEVIQVGFETINTGLEVRKPWKRNEDTGRIEWQMPISTLDYHEIQVEKAKLLEDAKPSRFNPLGIPQANVERKLKELESWESEALEDERRRMYALSALNDTAAEATVTFEKAIANDAKIKEKSPWGFTRTLEFLFGNVNKSTPAEVASLEKQMTIKSAEAKRALEIVAGRKVFTPPAPVTLARVEAERARRLKTNEGSLDFVTIEKELAAQDMADAISRGRNLTDAEAASYVAKAQQAKLDEIALRLKIQTNEGYFTSHPAFSATWEREPWREEKFMDAWATLELQFGRELTTNEIRKLKSAFVNAGTEMLAESVLDVTNFIEASTIIKAATWVPDQVRFARAAARGLPKPVSIFEGLTVLKSKFWQPAKLLRKVPIIGWLTREAISSVATKTANSLNTAINYFYKGASPDMKAFEDLLPALAQALRKTIGLTDQAARAVYNDITDPTNAAYIQGANNISFSQFVSLRDVADVRSGGIDPDQWKELYIEAAQEARREVEYKVKDLVKKANPKANERQLNALMKKELDMIDGSGYHATITNANFSKKFYNSFLEGHRVSVDSMGRRSQLLDDTFLGQLVQKIRMMSDTYGNVPRVKQLADLAELDSATRAAAAEAKRLGLSAEDAAKAWEELHGAVQARRLTLGDKIDQAIVNFGRKFNAASASKVADIIEGVHWAYGRMYQVWAMSVLSLNPRWFIQNFIDSTSRSMIYGGNPLGDFAALTFGTKNHIVDMLGDLPIELGQSLARNGIDYAYSVPARYMYEGFKPGFGPYAWFKYEYDRIAREGITSMEDAPSLVSKVLGSRTKDPNVKSFLGGLGNALAAVPGAASDFNTAIEYTIRLRMFSREYFKLFDEFNAVFKNIGAESLSPAVKKLAMQIWDASDASPDRMTAMVDDFVETLTQVKKNLTPSEMKAKSWSLLFGDEVNEALTDLTPVERYTFMADLKDRFNVMRQAKLASGDDVNPDDIAKFVDDYRKGMTDEIQERIGNMNETMRKIVDGFDNPDRVPEPPTWDEAMQHQGGIPKPRAGASDTVPTRKTGNSKLTTLYKDIKEYMFPTVNREAVAGAADLKHAKYSKADRVVKSFTAAMEDFADVSVVKGKGVKVFYEGESLKITLGDEIMNGTPIEVKDALQDAIVRAVGLRDEDMYAFKVNYEQYVSDFKKFISSPLDVADRDEFLFMTYAGQLTQDKHLRSIIENMNGRPIEFEKAARVIRKSKLSASDVMDIDSSKDFAKFGNKPPEVKKAGALKNNSTADLYKHLNENAVSEYAEDLAYFLGSAHSADGQLWKYLAEVFPGPAKIKNPKRRAKMWQTLHGIQKDIFDSARERNEFILDLLRTDPAEAARYLKEFNTSFASSYLDGIGFKELTFDTEGRVMSFRFQLKDRSIMRSKFDNHHYDIDNLNDYFFGDTASFLFNRNKMQVIDPTKFLDPARSPLKQIQTSIVNSFGLTETQSEAFAQVILKRSENLAARSGIPLDDVLTKHLGFMKVDGKLSAGSGVALTKSMDTDGAGRFVFYGYGSKNFNGIVSQMAQMHYRDLVLLAGRGDAMAVADLRQINRLLERLDWDIDPINGGKFLSDEQAKLLSDVYAEWVKTGITEQTGLKGPFRRMSEMIGDSYQKLVQNVDVLNEGVDASTFNLLDKAFNSVIPDAPKSNSFLIRAMAKKNGLPTKASDLLNLINSHPSVLGLPKETHDLLIKSMIESGMDAEMAEYTYDLMRFHGTSLSKDGSPDAWLKSFTFVDGDGNVDFLEFAKAADINPMFSLGMDKRQLDSFVDQMLAGKNKNLGEMKSNLRAALDDASPDERLHMLAYMDKKDRPLAKEMAKYLTDNKKLFQSKPAAPAFFLKSKDIINTKFKGTMKVEDARRFLLNNGISKDEMYWSGLDDMLTPKRPTTDLPSASDYKASGIVDYLKEGSDAPGAGDIVYSAFDSGKTGPQFHFDGVNYYDPWVPNKKYASIKDALKDIDNTSVTKENLLNALESADFRLGNSVQVSNPDYRYADTVKDDLKKLTRNSFGSRYDDGISRKATGVYTTMEFQQPLIIEYDDNTFEVLRVNMTRDSLDEALDILRLVDYNGEHPAYEGMNLLGGSGYRNVVTMAPTAPNFTSAHFEEITEKYLYHTRTEDVGKTRLLLELQSDRVSNQAANLRQLGKYTAELTETGDYYIFYGGELVGRTPANSPEDAVKSFYNVSVVPTPLSDVYVDNGIKNLVRQSVEDGMDSIAFVTSKDQVAQIEKWAQKGDTFEDTLARLAMAETDTKAIESVARFYTDVLPKKMKKFADRFGLKIEQETIDGELLNVIRFSEEMKKSVMEVGQPMWQKAAEVKKGAYWMEGGRRYIALFKDKDVSTPIHELAHSALDELANLKDGRIGVIERWAGIEEGSFKKLQAAFNSTENTPEIIKLRDEYVRLHEMFANGALGYHMTQEAPLPELIPIFKWFRDKLAAIWHQVKAMVPELNDEIIKVYDSLYSKSPNLGFEKRYSSLGDVPMEVAEKIFNESADTRLSNDLNAAFNVWKKSKSSAMGMPAEYTSTYATFKRYLTERIEDSTGEIENEYRELMWSLENLSQQVGRYKFGDDLLEHLTPEIPKTMVGDSVKTVIAHNEDNIRVLNSMITALDVLKKDWTSRANGANLLKVLTRDEADELQAYMTKAARNKSGMLNMIIHGGDVTDDAGKRLASSDGAMSRVNKVLLDYGTRTNLDQFMKNFFPFWMFPSRSLPFWAETLATHPGITSLYFKLKRVSERQRYQAGAIDSQGRPITSLNGYVKLPGTDLWVNPLAPMSFRYILDLYKFVDAKDYQTPDSEETLTGLPYVVKEFMQNAPIIGFNMSPWLGYLSKRALGIPDSIMPGWSISPQFNLIPKWAVMPFIEGLPSGGEMGGGFGDAVRYWMFPEPNWQDSLTETRLRENALEKMKTMSPSEFESYKKQVENAIRGKGNNPLWLETYKELTQDDATRNFFAFFTGVYAKTFTDGSADLISLKLYNKAMQDAMNNDVVAVQMGLPLDDEKRWEQRQDWKNAETPEAWSMRMYTATGWIKNDAGKLVTDPDERNRLLARQVERMNESQDLYFSFKELDKWKKDELAKLPIGSPSSVTSLVYDEYYKKLSALQRRTPDYNYLGSAKPVSLIEKELRNDWWFILRSTMPTYEVEKETFTDYEAKVAAWKLDLPKQAELLGKYYEETVTYRVGALSTEQQAKFNKNIIKSLISETSGAGYDTYRLENDSVWDAANEVWKTNYWNKYWDALEGLDGQERKYAEKVYQLENPEPDATTIYNWISKKYGNRFTLDEVKSLLGEGEDQINSINERLNINQTPEEKAENDIWTLLSWAGMAVGQEKLTDIYQALGGSQDDITTWYQTDGLGYANKPEKLMQIRDTLSEAASKLKLTEPTRAELRQRVEVERANDKFKEWVNDELGRDFLRREDLTKGISNGIYTNYVSKEYEIQKEIRADKEVAKKIQTYYKMRDTYAKENPLWAQYYYEYVDFKDLDVPVQGSQAVKPVKPVVKYDPNVTYNGGGVSAKSKRVDRVEVQPDPSKGSSFVPEKRTTRLSITTWPEGFREVAGNEIADEIEGLLKRGKFLSLPAKQYLYDMAKRHRKFRGFIYNILSK